MTGWNNLLALLDSLFGFPNKASSKVKKLQQGFDNQTQEHVIWLEYRVRVNTASAPKAPPSHVDASRDRQMAMLRELLASSRRPR